MLGINVYSVIAALLAVTTTCLGASIDQLVKQADAVFIGTGDQPVQNGRVVSIRLSVERVYKGDLAPGSVLYVNWDAGTAERLWRTPPSFHGVWFLRSVGQEWEFIPAQANPSRALSYLQYSTSALKSAAPVADPNMPAPDQLVAEVVNSPNSDAWTIYHATADSNSPATITALRKLAASPSSDDRTFGLAGLLNRGDTAALQQLETAGQALSSSRSFAIVPSALRFGFRNATPEAVQGLGRLAQGRRQPIALRSAAAQALSAIHTRDTLPYLAGLLDEQDPALVSCAVMGLSFFANGVGVQTPAAGLDFLNQRQPSAYATEETARYLGFDPARQAEFAAFWRRWWADNRAALTQ
jgi:hypothetical protein